MNPTVLLEQIVVQVSRDGQTGHGTGFYLIDDLVITCYHVLVQSGSMQDIYWIKHDSWNAWVDAKPIPWLCHPQPRDTAVLRCLRTLKDKLPIRITDWSKTITSFASRGYDQGKKQLRI